MLLLQRYYTNVIKCGPIIVSTLVVFVITASNIDLFLKIFHKRVVR